MATLAVHRPEITGRHRRGASGRGFTLTFRKAGRSGAAESTLMRTIRCLGAVTNLSCDTKVPMSLALRPSVLLSLMRALWQNVLPDLRGVTLLLDGKNQMPRVTCRFLYEGPVGDLQQACVWETETELIADFPTVPTEMNVEFMAVAFAKRDLEPGEEWVYLRWEPLE